MKPRMLTVLATMPYALALTLAGGSAWADVKAGVDAWSQGDYAKALKIWRPLAESGDADAQFNIAQAYKFGRGVPQDMTAAIDYYRKAAAQGHAQAEDNAGLLLYQQGRQSEAIPYLDRSAERGESRAQYLVGISLFNGDLVARDWVRAYAMMNRASAAGVEQAAKALEHMDRFIPEAQRKDGLELAATMTAHTQQPDQKIDTPANDASAPWRPAPPLRRCGPPPCHPLSPHRLQSLFQRPRPLRLDQPSRATAHGRSSSAHSANRHTRRCNGKLCPPKSRLWSAPSIIRNLRAH